MNPNACRSDLVLAERRGSLSVTERDALYEHLRDCEHCRILRDFGSAFDEPESIRPDDAERLDGMVEAANRWLGAPRGLRHSSNRSLPYKTLWLATAITISASAAAAAIVVRSKSMFHRPPESVLAQPSTSALTPVTSSSIMTTAEVPKELLAPQAERPERAANNAPSVEETAEQLFHQANEARRSKNVAQTTRLFRKLQRLYPSSREARLSEVVLGTFLLDQGQANAALEQLNRYLASGSGQSLTAEAYYGKGRALAQLGRAVEEQATWHLLLEQFPKSPYASQARKRLIITP